MKKAAVLLFAMVMCFLLVACGCEHQYEAKITEEASCTIVGTETFTCKLCQKSYTEKIPMIEHSYTSEITKEPSCTEKGITTFTCSQCKGSYMEDIEMVEHAFGDAVVTKEPTCTTVGEKTFNCTVCGTTKSAGEISTVPHSYVSNVKVAATCLEGGVNILKCSMCGDEKEEQVGAEGHSYRESNVITDVTCTSDGEVTMSCDRCGDAYNEKRNATGHDWVAATCTKAKYCANCSQTEGDALGHRDNGNGQCMNCNATLGLSARDISVKLKIPTVGDKNCYAEIIVINWSDSPITLPTLMVINGKICTQYEEYTLRAGYQVKTTYYRSPYPFDQFSNKFYDMYLDNSCTGSCVLEWEGEQYYVEFGVNGITEFYKGNALGPAA